MKAFLKKHSLHIRLFLAIFFASLIIQNIEAIIKNAEFDYITPFGVAFVATIISFFVKRK